MSWEAITALSTLASAVVVTVAALAAVRQIRHFHLGNQLDVVLRIYERFDSVEMIEENAEPIWAGFQFFAALHERTTPEQRTRRYPRWFRARLRST